MHIGFMVTILGVRGLDSSVNIMRFINKNMLVIEVNNDFSLINGFMYKYTLNPCELNSQFSGNS